MKVILSLLSSILLFMLSAPAGAHHEAQHQLPPLLRDVGFEQRLGESIPPDLVFRDETGKDRAIG